jgi:hypothetical protein
MPDDLPFAERLRADLLAAAAERSGRPSKRRRSLQLASIGAAIIAIVVAIVLVQVHGTKVASAGVDITIENGQIQVRLTDLEHRPQVIEDAVRAAGIDLTVQDAPVGPSLVGKFVTNVSSAPIEALVQPVDVDHLGNFGGFAVPVDWKGHLDLVVGRPAVAGELYLRASDAFAVGEPLHCSALRTATGGEAASELPTSTVHFRFRAIDPNTFAATDLVADAVAGSAYASLEVASAEAISATDVVIVLTADGLPLQRGAVRASEEPC